MFEKLKFILSRLAGKSIKEIELQKKQEAKVKKKKVIAEWKKGQRQIKEKESETKQTEKKTTKPSAIKMSKLTKELVQELLNKFADTNINEDDVYVQFASNSPNFFNQVAIDKSALYPELFTIQGGVYRKEDGMGYKVMYGHKDKDELIKYLTSAQGIEDIEESLNRLLEKAILMD